MPDSHYVYRKRTSYEVLQMLRVENRHLRDKLADAEEMLRYVEHHCNVMDRILDNHPIKEQAE